MTIAIATSLGTGRSTATLRDAYLTSRIRRSNRPVIYLGGAGSDATEAVGGIVPAVRPILYALAKAGFTVVSPTVTQTWGNATTLSRTDDVLDWARGSLGCTDDPPVLVGASHGGACAASYALNRDVACFIGLIPAVDVNYLREENVLGLRTAMDTALGVTYPTPAPTLLNPVENNPGCPTQLWYAPDDPVSVGIVDYAADIGAELNSVGNLGHSNGAIAAIDIDAVVSFALTQV